MTLAEWLTGFRRLHETARKGTLSERDRATYLAARNELAQALLATQRISLQPGQVPRRALRVPCALQVDLEFHDGSERAITRDVSAAGFAALLSRPPAVHDEVKVALRIPGGEPLRGQARVIEVKRQTGNAHACFEFIGLDRSEADHLESFVFDAVLERLKT
jgi:hypothetical protein